MVSVHRIWIVRREKSMASEELMILSNACGSTIEITTIVPKWKIFVGYPASLLRGMRIFKRSLYVLPFMASKKSACGSISTGIKALKSKYKALENGCSEGNLSEGPRSPRSDNYLILMSHSISICYFWIPMLNICSKNKRYCFHNTAFHLTYAFFNRFDMCT